jgi:hypothetical protein
MIITRLKPGPKPTPGLWQRIYRLRDGGRSLSMIARAVGKPEATVRYALKHRVQFESEKEQKHACKP